jgi:hypothetical protein
MGPGEKAPMRRRIGIVAIAALAALLALGAASPAVAKKKKKKPPATTTSATVPFAAGATASGTATCTGKTHLSGGGFAVAPNFNNPAGLRSFEHGSHPVDAHTWSSTGTSFTTPAGSGSLTTFARCESNTLGQLTTLSSSTVTIPASSGGDIVVGCPPGSHVVSGGYQADGPIILTNPQAATFRILVLASHRTSTSQWTVTAFNRTGAPPSNLTAFALCEKDKKGSSISEASASAPINPDVRASADANCTGKTHMVGGGFLLTPSTFPSNPTLIASVDESNPVGNKGWHIGLWQHPSFTEPAGSTLQTIAYCKKDAVSKKKK